MSKLARADYCVDASGWFAGYGAMDKKWTLDSLYESGTFEKDKPK